MNDLPIEKNVPDEVKADAHAALDMQEPTDAADTLTIIKSEPAVAETVAIPSAAELAIANSTASSPSEVSVEPTSSSPPKVDSSDAVKEMRRRTRRSFLTGGIGALAAFGGWKWLRSRREVDGIAWPFRASHQLNEQLSLDYFSAKRLARNYPRELATEPRANGEEGLRTPLDLAAWTLSVNGLANPPDQPEEGNDAAPPATKAPAEPNAKTKPGDTSKKLPHADSKNEDDSGDEDDTDPADAGSDDTADAGTDQQEAEPVDDAELSLTMADIRQFPRVEMVTQLKCIEGWSVVVQWAGIRLADLIAKYPPLTQTGNPPDVAARAADLVRYVSIETPDGEYYVGLDMESALHPQTLLAYEMNAQPLSEKHGAPLRLVIPVKYGIKHIKRIGKITYTNTRPKDYWAEQGYDWYSGH